MIFLLTALGASLSECETTLEDQDVRGIGRSAVEAFINLDLDNFQLHRDHMFEGFACSKEPLSTSAVAAYFRVRALDAFLRRSPTDIRDNVRALTEIDPLPMSTSFAPRGGALRNAWLESKTLLKPDPTTLPVPAGARLLVDGTDNLTWHPHRPTVVQLVHLGGEVGWTEVVEMGSRVPLYETAPESSRAKYMESVVVPLRRRPIELPILFGLTAAGAAATGIASFRTRALYEQSAPIDRKRTRATNNLVVATSTGLAVTAASLGVWTYFAW